MRFLENIINVIVPLLICGLIFVYFRRKITILEQSLDIVMKMVQTNNLKDNCCDQVKNINLNGGPSSNCCLNLETENENCNDNNEEEQSDESESESESDETESSSSDETDDESNNLELKKVNTTENNNERTPTPSPSSDVVMKEISSLLIPETIHDNNQENNKQSSEEDNDGQEQRGGENHGDEEQHSDRENTSESKTIVLGVEKHTEEELKKMNNTELRDLLKIHNVAGIHRMKKNEMIVNILSIYNGTN